MRALLRELIDPGSPLGKPAEPGAPAGGDEDGRRILAVSHSTLGRILCCVALGVQVREFRRRFVLDQTSITVIRWADGSAPEDGELILLNDAEHLRRRGEAPWG